MRIDAATLQQDLRRPQQTSAPALGSVGGPQDEHPENIYDEKDVKAVNKAAKALGIEDYEALETLPMEEPAAERGNNSTLPIPETEGTKPAPGVDAAESPTQQPVKPLPGNASRSASGNRPSQTGVQVQQVVQPANSATRSHPKGGAA